MQLWIAAAQVEPACALGEPGVDKRGELDELRSQLLEQVERVAVVEAERLVTRDRDAGSVLAGHCCGRAGSVLPGHSSVRTGSVLLGHRVGAVELRGSGGELEQRVEVDGVFEHRGDAVERVTQALHLGGGHQPEVPALQAAVGEHGQVPEHGNARLVFDDLLEAREVPRRNAVDDDAADLARVAKAHEPGNFRRSRQRASAPVDDENARRVGLGGKLPGRRLRAARDAVVVAHRAFDDRDVRLPRALREKRAHERGIGEEQVEVARGGPNHLRVEHRVDVVRAALAGLHLEPAPHERAHQPAGDRRLARGARRCRYEHTWCADAHAPLASGASEYAWAGSGVASGASALTMRIGFCPLIMW